MEYDTAGYKVRQDELGSLGNPNLVNYIYVIKKRRNCLEMLNFGDLSRGQLMRLSYVAEVLRFLPSFLVLP